MSTFIIAEAGSNHSGSLEIAKEMIEVAKECGADAVKFQLFRARTMYPNKFIEVKYLKDTGEKKDLYSLIENLEVPQAWIPLLVDHALKNNIEFMATPFDLEAVGFLNPYVNYFKIASYECLYEDLINEVKKTKKPVFISTGGCTESEIDLLVNRLLFDYKDKTALLHCIAKYPTPIEQANLGIIPYLAKKYGIKVGYSDHTREPIVAPVVAVALGAKVIEKHFTLNRKMAGPDHAYAVEPDELKAMVEAIRSIEKSIIPSNRRDLQGCENELYFYKRCIYLNCNLSKGQKIKKSHLVMLRGTGEVCIYFSPTEIDNVVGRILKRDKKANEIIRHGDLV